MRNMLAFLAFAVIALAGTGWYLDWYSFHTSPAPEGKRSVTVDINTSKISQDLAEAEKRIQERLADKARQENGDPKEKKPLSLPAPGGSN